MNKKNRSNLGWKQALGALAIGLGTMGINAIPATASPIENEIILSQVGVRSRITPPTPLNLRPRTHIPLPQSNYSRYGNYRGHHSHYNNYRQTHHGRTHRKRRSNRGTVIIISPGNHRNYSNYGSNGYIRVIRK